MIQPPRDITPARLFRIMLQRPFATAPIAYRIKGAEDVPLLVRALRSAEEMAIVDAADGPVEMRRPRAADELVHRALLTQDGPAFASPDDVGALMAGEAEALASAVREALNVISPTYVLHDHAAWHRVLQQGAKAPGNWPDAIALGGCSDFAFGFGVGRQIERPDRYFGTPLADLTDGQWMAYRAAREVYQKEFLKT